MVNFVLSSESILLFTVAAVDEFYVSASLQEFTNLVNSALRDNGCILYEKGFGNVDFGLCAYSHGTYGRYVRVTQLRFGSYLAEVEVYGYCT